MKNKRTIFIILFIILIAYVVLVGGTIPYFILYICLLTFFIPLFHSLIILNSIEGTVSIPEKSLYTQDKITINYKINNNSIFHIPYLEIESNISKQLTGMDSKKIIKTLKAKESFSYDEVVVLKRRGYYELGEVEITIKDVFGFFNLKKNISSEASLLVYPEAISLSTFRITAVEQMGELLVENPVFQDKSRISSVRDYQDGDLVKSIHWKLSAKSDNLVVKEYENRGDAHVIILIDNYNKFFEKDVDRRLEDKIVDVALSIIDYYINQNIPVHFQTQNGNNLVNILGEQSSDIKYFLEALARFRGNGTLDFYTFVNSRIDTLRKDATTIVITPNLDKTMGALGISLKAKNLKPLFINVMDMKNNNGFFDPKVEESLKQESIPLYILDWKTNIKETLEVQYG